MAQKSPAENGSPEQHPTSSEETGAELTRSIAGNVIERHSLAKRADDSSAPTKAEVAAEQGAGSLSAIQQGGQMRDIGSQAALDTQESALLDDALHRRIAIAAYYRAERRGFEAGHEIEDWLEAEREVGEREGSGAIG